MVFPDNSYLLGKRSGDTNPHLLDHPRHVGLLQTSGGALGTPYPQPSQIRWQSLGVPETSCPEEQGHAGQGSSLPDGLQRHCWVTGGASNVLSLTLEGKWPSKKGSPQERRDRHLFMFIFS